MQNMDLGEVKPLRGRWEWPYAEMEEGEYFRVDQFKRPKGQLANLTHVRGSKLGMRFSVLDDPDYPGFTRVTCTAGKERVVEERQGMVRPKSVKALMPIEQGKAIIERFYSPEDAHEINAYGYWNSLFPGETYHYAAKPIEEPPMCEFVTTCSFNEHRCLVELKDDEIVMTGQPHDFRLEAWQKSKLLDD